MGGGYHHPVGSDQARPHAVNTAPAPITVALVNDYDIVIRGVAHIIDQYRDRVIVAEMDTNKPLAETMDIVLYDAFAQPESDQEDRRPGR